MTYSPATYLEIRALFRERTSLPAESLGIQHYSPQGGGYHEGNDLLAAAGRLDSDYSKRESDRDRPGTNGASAIDIGWFDVVLPNGRRVTLIDLNRWLVAQLNAGAPDTLWIREVIYTLDRQTVKRWDRLGIRSSGDDSHTGHTHVSGHRDEENTPKRPLFERFWREMAGTTAEAMARKADIDMIMVSRAGDPSRYLYHGAGTLGLAPETYARLQAIGLPEIGSADAVTWDQLVTKPLAAAGARALTLSEADRTAIVAAVVAALGQVRGATPAEVRTIVDEELDEQSRAGADAD